MTDPLAPIAPQFKTTGQTAIKMKESRGIIRSDDNATIEDKDGNLLFKIDAHLFTMSERRTLRDLNGAEIGQLRKKRMPTMHTTYYIGTMDNEKKCAVKKKGLMNITKCDADIYVDGEVVGEASGNWRAKDFSITIAGTQVAKIGRGSSLGFNALVFNADTYCIDILVPGVDLAYIALIANALDEMYHDNDS